MSDYVQYFSFFLISDVSCFVEDDICQRLILISKSFITVRSLMVAMAQSSKSSHLTGRTSLSSPVLQQERGLIL